MNDSVIFYRSFAKAIKHLPEEEQLKALWAIIDYGLDGEEPEDEGLYLIPFEVAKPQIDANTKRRTDGGKGGRPAKSKGFDDSEKEKTSGFKKEKPVVIEKAEKEKPNVNVNVNENVNVNVKEKNVSTEPEIPSAVPAHTLPLNTGEEYPVPDSDLAEYKDLFPAVDVQLELKRMRRWLNDNPSRRKTRNGIKRFITKWLSAEQDKAKPPDKIKPRGNGFNNFDQRSYDFDNLERQLLGISEKEGNECCT